MEAEVGGSRGIRRFVQLPLAPVATASAAATFTNQEFFERSDRARSRAADTAAAAAEKFTRQAECAQFMSA